MWIVSPLLQANTVYCKIAFAITVVNVDSHGVIKKYDNLVWLNILWRLLPATRENQICFIMGDFNFNLINFQRHQNTGEFLDGLHSNMFFPMITRPTRITSHTATLLDNIFANNCFDHSRSGLLITDISDHLPVFSIHSNNDSSNSHAHDPVVVRDNNKENLANVLETLKEINWSSLDGYHDPKNAYNSFIKKYS